MSQHPANMETASRILDAALAPAKSKIIECPICYDEYDHCSHTPMLLTCGHSICLQCAELLFPSDEAAECPTCRTCSTPPLAKNYQLSEQITLLSNDSANLLEPSVASAIRMATKTISFAIFGWTALCVLPWFLMPVGVLFCACAMFWVRIIGESCSTNSFVPSKSANKVLLSHHPSAHLLAAPPRPLRGLRPISRLFRHSSCHTSERWKYCS